MSTATPMSSGPRVPLAAEAPVEVVERKGVGHPDTLADAIAELASIRYSQHCLSVAGAVLHHNLDKVAVLGGRAVFTDTDGVYDRPLRVVFGGRISTSFAGQPVTGAGDPRTGRRRPAACRVARVRPGAGGVPARDDRFEQVPVLVRAALAGRSARAASRVLQRHPPTSSAPRHAPRPKPSPCSPKRSSANPLGWVAISKLSRSAATRIGP